MASSLSTVRIKFPTQYSSLNVRFLSSKLLEVQSTSCRRRTSVVVRMSSTFSVNDDAVVDGAGNVINDPLLDDPVSYQRLIDRLLYLTNTRPDITFVVQCLSQFMQAPKTSHMMENHRVVRYINQAPELDIFMPAGESECLSANCNVDWAVCPNTKKSVT